MLKIITRKYFNELIETITELEEKDNDHLLNKKAIDDHVANLNNDNQNLKSRNIFLSSQLKKVQKTLKDTQHSLKQISGSKGYLQKQYNELAKKLVEKNKEIDILNHKIDNYKADARARHIQRTPQQYLERQKVILGHK